ncbi:MAG TPA: hypothetical protein VEQ63_09370 [Bryobacteraceae bacterium]|nr:hypothetical protein [Bryobacteraceae bacterium]
MRLYYEAGWEVPGLLQAAGKVPSQRGTLDIDGTKVEYESFTIRGSPGAPARTYRLMFLSHGSLSEHDRADYVTWQSIEPKSISVYRVGRKVIGAIVEGVVRFDADPKTGAGGTGGEVRVAYQDVDGSGRMKLALQNLPLDFRPEVPAWAKKE